MAEKGHFVVSGDDKLVSRKIEIGDIPDLAGILENIDINRFADLD